LSVAVTSDLYVEMVDALTAEAAARMDGTSAPLEFRYIVGYTEAPGAISLGPL
jgi:hypothetical protein